MKVLLFSYNFGASSSGNITKEIADSLSKKGVDILVVCGHNFSSPTKYNVVTVNPRPIRPARFFKFLGNLLGIELNYIFWEWRCVRNFSLWFKNFTPDVVYSRGSPVSAMTVGSKFSWRYKVPLVLHFADPIPATKEWIKHRLESQKLKKTIKPLLRQANRISFVNKEMMEYQLSQINDVSFRHKSKIISNHVGELIDFGLPSHSIIIFLFLGTFSNQRNPNLILDTFLEVSSQFNNLEFHIYGNNKNTNAFKNYADKFSNIKFFDPVENITQVFKYSTILVDVDSNYENQVFLSGKLMQYLATDRYILSITTEKSPAAHLLSNLPCSFVIPHDSTSLKFAMGTMVKKDWNLSDFKLRRQLVNNLSLDSISYQTIGLLTQAIDE